MVTLLFLTMYVHVLHFCSLSSQYTRGHDAGTCICHSDMLQQQNHVLYTQQGQKYGKYAREKWSRKIWTTHDFVAATLLCDMSLRHDTSCVGSCNLLFECHLICFDFNMYTTFPRNNLHCIHCKFSFSCFMLFRFLNLILMWSATLPFYGNNV